MMSSLPITSSSSLTEAIRLPFGARFYRCALQVNPYSYIRQHPKPGSEAFRTEEQYNQAMVAALCEHKIEVVAVTDHYQVDGSQSLIEAAQAAGIIVFPAFEAVSKEGVHFLCIFPIEKTRDNLIGILGECGIQMPVEGSPTGCKDSLELLECVRRHGGISIAAHVSSNGGLFRTLSGQARANVWKEEKALLACSIPGTLDTAEQNHRDILRNIDVTHKRERPVAIINAQDLSAPEEIQNKPGTWCWIKMADVSVEGLRQAFLDPASRIRLQNTPIPNDHAEFVAIGWQGGDFHFHNSMAIHFNRDLNVLVGGRGTGKSTIVESIRYVLGLEPKGEDAKKAHEGVIKSVLKSGTKISLLVRSYRPEKHHYTIERTIPSPAVVKDEHGEVLNLKPLDIVPQAEVFGQHEISELTKDEAKLTKLLEKFVPRDGERSQRKQDLRRKLERSRTGVLEAKAELKSVLEKLAALPGLEETLKRYQSAGLEDKLKDRSLVVREERLFTEMKERLEPFLEWEASLRQGLPIDTTFLSAKALEDLPGASILCQALPVFEALNRSLHSQAEQLRQSVAVAEDQLSVIRGQWDIRKQTVQAAYEAILRELQQAKIDGEEFIRLRQQIEALRPLKDREALLLRTLQTQEAERRKLADAWQEVKRSEYEAVSQAAKKVSRDLKERVRVKVQFSGDGRPLIALLKEALTGTVMNEANRQKLQDKEDLSVMAFAQACRDGKDALVREFGLTPGAADKITQAGDALFMQIEELELPATTRIELNVSPAGNEPEWKTLNDLSTGQKATAVLLLLLLDSEAPLIVDQPEDDLDNRFITDGVVPIMREKKRQRQFIFSTHNANIPVLGDAELILGLQVREGKGEIPPENMGAIDTESVRSLVGEILEGGQAAFELRRLKYGY